MPHLPADVWLVLGMATLTVAAGVPLILASVRVHRDLKLELVDDADLTPAQREHYQRLDLAAGALGYRPRLNFRALNLAGPSLTRAYLSEAEPAVLGAHCMAASAGGGHNFEEWYTRHEDGTTLTTRNCEISTLFDRMPHQVIQESVGMRDLATLRERHRRGEMELLARSPRHPDQRKLLDEAVEFHRRWCDHQVARGRLVPLPDGALRPSLRTALRGVGNYFNPLADNFTVPRFALALLGGLGLPLLGCWAADPAAPLRPTGLPLLPLDARLTLGLGWVLGGAAVGAVFTSKDFIWGALLGWAALRLFRTGGLEALALLMAVTAQTVAHWRIRRRQLV
jgi:hypothetical protein